MMTDDYTPDLDTTEEIDSYAQAIEQGESDVTAAARGLLEMGYPREELFAALNETVKAYDAARRNPAPLPVAPELPEGFDPFA